MAQISSNKCHSCGQSNAGLYCYVCKFLCVSCRLFHDKFTNNHKVTESSKIDRLVFASTSKCKSHNLEYIHYCKNCKCLTCSACTTTVHRSHDFTDVKEVVASAREDLKQTNNNVRLKQDILSTLIDDIENIKIKKVQEEHTHFLEGARMISGELIKNIESVTKQHSNRAEDFLTNEQERMTFELASLRKLQEDCSAITNKIEEIIQIEHDITFYEQHKSLPKDFEETDSIPTIRYPNKIEEFKVEDFIDQVVENIQSKYGISCWKKKEDEIDKLKKEIDEERINICDVKACKDAETLKIRQEMSALLQIEKSKIKELEDEKRYLQSTVPKHKQEKYVNIRQLSKDKEYLKKSLKEEQDKSAVLNGTMNEYMRCLKEKDCEIQKLQKEIDDTKSRSTKINASKETDLQRMHQEMSKQSTLLHEKNVRIQLLESENKNLQSKLQVAENDLSKLRKDHEEAKTRIKELIDPHDDAKRKNQDEMDRLKFQVEVSKMHERMVPPGKLIGLRVLKKSFNAMLMLVAIEIGTFFSGCCYSYRGLNNDSEQNSIISPQCYTKGKLQIKIPTAILLNHRKEFKCFGDDAENRYSRLLTQEGKSHSWFYFTKFKTMLTRSQDLKSEIQMKTFDGTKELPAVLIYALTIKYFKAQIKKCMNSGLMSEDEIGWIITLPPLANVETQQLMIKAAMEAGISEEHLLVVSETDATVALCRSENGMPTIQCGARVLILDLGSGSFDVCVCEVQDDQSLNIQLNASFPAVGWPQVQNAFEEIFIGIVGNSVFQQYCNEYPEERRNWLEYIFRKICFGPEVQKEYMIIELPMDLQNVLYNETGKTFSELVYQSNLSDSLNCPANDKLKISLSVWHKLFDIPVQKIKYYVNRVTEMEGMESLCNIIITGGIIQSEKIQLQIKQLFLDKNIIIPKDVGFAVLRGAIAIGMR